MVIAQHGTRESPCTFFDVSEREHYSSTLDRHFRHEVLSIGYHFDGPTEIGGLVVDPARARRRGARRASSSPSCASSTWRCTRSASARRCSPSSCRRSRPDGRSLFWEAFGRRFTDLDYQTADKKSRENKEFIQQLFPPVDVYATLLPAAGAARRSGKVGAGDRAGAAAARADRLPLRRTASIRSTAGRTTRRGSRT